MRSPFLIATVICLLGIPALLLLSGAASVGTDWRTADRSSAGIAPDPEKTREAVVQVYAARARNWRGIFAVHTWIATKPENAPQFTVHQVIGWRTLRDLPALFSEAGIPDRRWFGAEPKLLADLRGPAATQAIDKILKAIETYPHPQEYRLWPGPNSNTFTAHVMRQVPELRVQFPVTAIGKDFPMNGSLVDNTPSGTGFQLSAYGLLGFLMAWDEGVEVNLLGLSFGIDVKRPALKLPLIGRIGFPVNPAANGKE